MPGTTPRLRADARRNRDLIVTAAQHLFLEQGVDVPLDEVARRAGVGIGTLYRRFPDRDALLRAVAEDTLRSLVGLIETARDEEPDAWHALCRFLRSCAELRFGELAAELDPRLYPQMRTGPHLDEMRRRVIAAVLDLTARAQAEGAMRPDAGPLDVAMLMTLHVYTPPNMPGDQAVRRMVEIVLDGLRAGSGSPLPGTPSTGAADLHRYTAVDP
ncbi:TetR/AcrR family transcriptional regulator [Spongiactinospora rosea]|uniref:TetR/AcrR family transcriptional regulator n=1 Tax=Spongiactinospora rosea TaxID=2248750 RepID=A0A366LQP9_9ACTN|nr:TetR/AcrR family transcriptional regulator [Spongiactinospora rosea]RBQ16218.1 TetR/AcrR family transcriptional regulator [Spongiactinospora rosea]